jgi:hypothetical protein
MEPWPRISAFGADRFRTGEAVSGGTQFVFYGKLMKQVANSLLPPLSQRQGGRGA